MIKTIEKNKIVDNFTDILLNSIKQDIYNLLENNNDITPGIFMDILIGSHLSSLFNHLETLKNGVPEMTSCIDTFTETVINTVSKYGTIEKVTREVEKAH